MVVQADWKGYLAYEERISLFCRVFAETGSLEAALMQPVDSSTNFIEHFRSRTGGTKRVYKVPGPRIK